MTTRKQRASDKGESGTARRSAPQHKGGDQARKAQEWGGGSKAAKGQITESDRSNPNSSQKG